MCSGTCVRAKLRPGVPPQVLVRVPRALLMNAHTARGSPACGRLVAEAGLNEWQALLLQLLCERAAGEASFWAPYVAVLPQDMVGRGGGGEGGGVCVYVCVLDSTRKTTAQRRCTRCSNATAYDLTVCAWGAGGR